MGVKNELNGASSTRYYRWDGRAYHVHDDERGDLTSDIYLAGSDEVSISAFDVMDGTVHVRQDETSASNGITNTDTEMRK